ncbi:peptide deformylase [Ancylobacter sp. A5.8]|uniref:peptide deformylase n=1 Tax=Ancylobacter gelatini TaxID=2919920 RepID=UPI001F4E6BE8|nr:peptide deformylase [Ancylobacter gelatini]MCJ8144390.1 peptide deformylase [Ancylobacter gelatini]
MSVRPILRWPDPKLRLKAAPVTAFDADLRALADDLRDTMRAAPGIGITGPHIGVMARVVVLELSEASGVRVYVNPVVEWTSPEQTRHPEGSVSMPGVTEEVERPARVRIAYQDLDGAARVEEADGLLAVCHQHEIDQLDGIFWLHRLSRLKRERVIKRFEKLGRA